MTFNASKCFLLRVTCSRDNVVNYTYTMMGEPITSVTQHMYLGVELDSKLTWNEHISAITGKANSSLAFLRKNLDNCPEQIKTQAYYSLVWPHLEYACSLWDPHTQKNIQSIEKVLHSVDCKTVHIFAYSSTRKQSNKRSGTRLKTESETGERR